MKSSIQFATVQRGARRYELLVLTAAILRARRLGYRMLICLACGPGVQRPVVSQVGRAELYPGQCAR